MGAVDKSIYKAYFKSAESPILLSAVVILFIIGQIAISAIDLIVSKWFVDLLESNESFGSIFSLSF